MYRFYVFAFRTNNFANNFRAVIAQETVNARTPYIHIHTYRVRYYGADESESMIGIRASV